MDFKKLFYSEETAKSATLIVDALNKSKRGEGILEKLRVKNRTLKETAKDKSYRIINYWTKTGLLDAREKGDLTWRKYSIIDAAFLHIICELRDLGIPTKEIERAKNVLYSAFPSNKNKLQITILEFLFARVATEKNFGNLYLTFDKDSNYTFFSSADIKKTKLVELLPSASVIINLNRLLKHYFGGRFQEHTFKEDIDYADN